MESVGLPAAVSLSQLRIGYILANKETYLGSFSISYYTGVARAMFQQPTACGPKMARRKSANPRHRALRSSFDNSQGQDIPDIDRRCLQKRSCTVGVENNPSRIDGWKCAIVLEPQQPCVILSISAPSQNVPGPASLSFPVETCDINMGLEKPDHGEEEVARLRKQYPGWFKKPESKHRFIRIQCMEDPVEFSMPWDVQEETCQRYDDLSRLIKKGITIWILEWWNEGFIPWEDMHYQFRMLQVKVLGNKSVKGERRDDLEADQISALSFHDAARSSYSPSLLQLPMIERVTTAPTTPLPPAATSIAGTIHSRFLSPDDEKPQHKRKRLNRYSIDRLDRAVTKEYIDKGKNNNRQPLSQVDLERSRLDVRIAIFEHKISGLEYEISERRLRVAKLREKLAKEHIARSALDN